MMTLFYVLQITMSITIYESKFPGQALLFLEQVRSLIEFRMLKPDSILGMFKEGLTLDSIFNKASKKMSAIPKNMESSGFVAGSPMSKIQPFLMGISILVLSVVFIWMLTRAKSISDEKKEKLRGILANLKK